MLIYNKKELYKFLGWGLFFWYACLRWTIQTNRLGSFVTDEHGVMVFILEWIFTPINMMTAFVSIYFISKILVDFNKSFNALMGLMAFFLVWRNGYYTFEDYKDYILNPSSLQLIFIGIDLAMVVYVSIWAIIYWSMNNDKRNR